MLASIAKFMQFKIEKCGSGEEAIRKISRRNFQLVIIYYTMPVLKVQTLSGKFNFCRHAKIALKLANLLNFLCADAFYIYISILFCRVHKIQQQKSMAIAFFLFTKIISYMNVSKCYTFCLHYTAVSKWYKYVHLLLITVLFNS